MTVQAKICGLRDPAAVAAAVEGGARYLGFVFYPKSPRAVDAVTAAALVTDVPDDVMTVGLFVDPTDDELTDVLRVAPLRMIQLHGKESPERVVAVKKLTGLPVIKAVGIATAQDIETVRLYESVADFLLLDAKAPTGGLPGGNAVAFDWALIAGATFQRPWLLAGGLTAENCGAAVKATGARILDVSSGVEEAVGVKSLAKIRAFLVKIRGIETCS